MRKTRITAKYPKSQGQYLYNPLNAPEAILISLDKYQTSGAQKIPSNLSNSVELKNLSELYFGKIFNDNIIHFNGELRDLSGSMNDILDPNEEIIWNAKPDKKSLMLSALVGVPFGLFFLVFSTIWLVMGATFLESPLVITIPAAIILIAVPIIWQYRKIPNAEYMITNQRLIIKSGITEQDVWFAELDKIKDTFVKTGLADKILGTGKLFPITAEYPYEPELYRAYDTEGGMRRPIKVYNIVEQKYEEIIEKELYRKSQTHPRLEGLTEPYAVQKLLKEAIFGAGTNYVSCKYCHFRYDLNKEGKCPHCGGTQSQKYSSI